MSRYKDITLNKIQQVESNLSRLQFEINRNESQDRLLDTVEKTREVLEELRSLVSIEQDDFASQFKQ